MLTYCVVFSFVGKVLTVVVILNGYVFEFFCMIENSEQVGAAIP